MMTAVEQQTKNAITLKGSVKLITEYLSYGINSILYQRGIYPPETFKAEEHFGLAILVSTENKIQLFLQNVLDQTTEWLEKEQIKQMSLVISSISTQEVMERWDFKIEYENTNKDKSVDKDGLGNKEMTVIQKEIRDVLRQICSTVSFLPLLDCPCSFDLHIHTYPEAEIPDLWDERGPSYIPNSQELQLRSFSTSLHKMSTIVSYKSD